MAGFWDIAEIVLPIAASVVGTPAAGAAVAGLTSAAKSKSEGGSWADALTRGGISAGLGFVGGKGAEKLAGKATEKAAEKVTEKAAEKATEKAAEKVAEKGAEKGTEAAVQQRVSQAIGKKATSQAQRRAAEQLASEEASEQALQEALKSGKGTVTETANAYVDSAAAQTPTDKQVRFHEAQQELLNNLEAGANEYLDEAAARRQAAEEESKRFLAQLQQQGGGAGYEPYRSPFYTPYGAA
jgi:hypothetical protein